MTKLLHVKELNHITETKHVHIYLNSGKYKVVLCLLVPLCLLSQNNSMSPALSHLFLAIILTILAVKGSIQSPEGEYS